MTYSIYIVRKILSKNPPKLRLPILNQHCIYTIIYIESLIAWLLIGVCFTPVAIDLCTCKLFTYVVSLLKILLKPGVLTRLDKPFSFGYLDVIYKTYITVQQ